jgi:hypothetical protein
METYESKAAESLESLGAAMDAALGEVYLLAEKYAPSGEIADALEKAKKAVAAYRDAVSAVGKESSNEE